MLIAFNAHDALSTRYLNIDFAMVVDRHCAVEQSTDASVHYVRNVQQVLESVVYDSVCIFARTINRAASEQRFVCVLLNNRGRSKATSQVMMQSQVPVLAIKYQGAQLRFLKAPTKSKDWASSQPRDQLVSA